MTIGQRIAQKRKELELSQEALGERLGVSRQSIYKWESDQSLPEIDKLVAMSRLFGVTVGWLLGVEEGEEPRPADESEELTEEQLKMVEEIVSRYLAAQPKPVSKTRRRIFKVAVAVAGICLAVGLWKMSERLEQIQYNYNTLQNSVGNLTSSVNGQIGGIADRVEEVLKAQGSLLVDYDIGQPVISVDGNEVSFTISAQLKTYVPGVSVEWEASSDDAVVTAAAAEGENRVFSGTITCPLSNNISLSAAVINGEKRETQLLDNYTGLLNYTYPQVSFVGGIHLDSPATVKIEKGKAALVGDLYLPVTVEESEDDVQAEIRSIQVGLFCNKKLIAWGDPCQQPSSYQGDFSGWKFYVIHPTINLPGTYGDVYTVAALVTDEYGRQFLTCSDGLYFTEEEGFEEYFWLDDKEQKQFMMDYGENLNGCGPTDGWTW